MLKARSRPLLYQKPHLHLKLLRRALATIVSTNSCCDQEGPIVSILAKIAVYSVPSQFQIVAGTADTGRLAVTSCLATCTPSALANKGLMQRHSSTAVPTCQLRVESESGHAALAGALASRIQDAS